MAETISPFRIGATLVAIMISVSTLASETPPPAYQLAAYSQGIPSEVLYAITLHESGTRIRGRIIPWPWTLNVAGASFRFSNRSSACTALLLAINDVGAKRVDAGLGQINVGWNGHRFASPCEALDPYKNLSVTAEILLEQYKVTQNWMSAAGRYHRPAGGKPAERYKQYFAKQLARVRGDSAEGFLATNP